MKGPLFWAGWGVKGRSQAWNPGPEGEGGGRKAPSLNAFLTQQGRRAGLRDSLFAVATCPLSPSPGPHLSATPESLLGVTGRARTRARVERWAGGRKLSD